MKLRNKIYIFLALLLFSLILCFNFLSTSNRLVTFDGLTHMSNIAQFYTALNDGDFPVRWLGKSANYGMPFGIFSEQTVAYLGTGLMFLLHSTLTSFNLVILLFAFGSCLTLYLFLREYADRLSSLTGTFLFCFVQYRIVNIYIRGAIPEFAASLLLPLMLLSLKRWITDKKTNYYFIFIISLTLLFLTHPISAIVFSVFIGIYYIYLLRNAKNKIRVILATAFAILLSLGISSYYLLPLTQEFKYLNEGRDGSIFVKGSYVNFKDFFADGSFGTDYIRVGLIELGIFLGGLTYIINRLKKRKNVDPLIIISFVSLTVYLFLISKLAIPLFTFIKPFGEVQHQWRFMGGIIFIAPVLLALLLPKLGKRLRYGVIVLVVVSVIILRFPNLHAKSYTPSTESDYNFSVINLYSEEMNTLWTGSTGNYPVKKVKGEIVKGTGQIIIQEVHNSWRIYVVDNKNETLMVDNTFYFPGWNVYVDGNPISIEFQDINNRGIITYKVPAGPHTIHIKFEDTKLRRFADLISVVSIALFLTLLFFAKKKSGVSA